LFHAYSNLTLPFNHVEHLSHYFILYTSPAFFVFSLVGFVNIYLYDEPVEAISFSQNFLVSECPILA